MAPPLFLEHESSPSAVNHLLWPLHLPDLNPNNPSRDIFNNVSDIKTPTGSMPCDTKALLVAVLFNPVTITGFTMMNTLTHTLPNEKIVS